MTSNINSILWTHALKQPKKAPFVFVNGLSRTVVGKSIKRTQGIQIDASVYCCWRARNRPTGLHSKGCWPGSSPTVLAECGSHVSRIKYTRKQINGHQKSEAVGGSRAWNTESDYEMGYCMHFSKPQNKSTSNTLWVHVLVAWLRTSKVTKWSKHFGLCSTVSSFPYVPSLCKP